MESEAIFYVIQALLGALIPLGIVIGAIAYIIHIIKKKSA